MIRLLVAKKQKFPLTKKSAKLLRIEYIRDFIREPFFLSYFGLYCSTSCVVLSKVKNQCRYNGIKYDKKISFLHSELKVTTFTFDTP